MPVTPDEVPGLVAQAWKLKDAIVNVVVKFKSVPSPATGTGICGALGIPAGTPLYVLAETIDLVARDVAS